MRILVVEDEMAMADSIKRGLEAEGMAVDVALDGETGLWLAREHDYDAMILDLMLPKINGYVVCKTIREEGIWTPVLMLTAKHGEFDEAEGLDAGADDYVTKPFSFVVLLARLRALVRRRGGERPTVLTAGDLSLDPARRVVTRGETEIDVTAREFAILQVLIRRVGDVISKREILESVWALDFEGDTNIVEVYVSSLRKKIDAPFDRASLETVRGMGYRLNAEGP